MIAYTTSRFTAKLTENGLNFFMTSTLAIKGKAVQATPNNSRYQISMKEGVRRFSGTGKNTNKPIETKTNAKINSIKEIVNALDFRISFPLKVENKAEVKAAIVPNKIPAIGFSEFSNSDIPIILMMSIINTPIIISFQFSFRL